MVLVQGHGLGPISSILFILFVIIFLIASIRRELIWFRTPGKFVDKDVAVTKDKWSTTSWITGIILLSLFGGLVLCALNGW